MNEKAIIFIGGLENRTNSASDIISNYILKELENRRIEVAVFNLSEANIPLLDFSYQQIPASVEKMLKQFLDADIHFWLSPLYHGSIPGIMKNCLDWLELTGKLPEPYLTNKKVGMVCWSDGVQSMNGIDTMEKIAKSLRAWPLPYSVSIVRNNLMDEGKTTTISDFYIERLDRLINIATSTKIQFEPSMK